jgi:Holliday junction resolvasome RuvABC endonuclease subunit
MLPFFYVEREKVITLSVEKLEKQLGKLIRRNITVLGVDTASRSGWCRITVNAKVHIDYGFIDIDSKDRNFKFNQMIDIFPQLLEGCDKVVIEDVFLKFNVMIHAMLSRIGMIVYVLAHQKGIKEKEWKMATSARKDIGLKGRGKKEEVHKEFREKMELDITDIDIVDSIILALSGILL